MTVDMRKRIYPYNQYSRSARDLARAINCLRIRKEGSRYRYRAGDTVINWGSTECPFPCINTPSAVERAADKTLTLQALDGAGVSIPLYTTSRETAAEWLSEGKKVVCRTPTTDNSGRGVVIAEELGQLVDTPLYTTYVTKKD